jgi:uncharacterized Zn-binding protein involved in type VI secretion
MNKIWRVADLLLLAVSAFAFTAQGAMAQQGGSETVSIQINVTTPGGASVVGTLVARRQCGSTTVTDLSFNGMINGKPTTATASADETWSGDSKAEISNLKVTSWESSVPRPVALDLTIVQAAPGVITVNGVPAAIDGDLKGPCGGRTTYMLTNAGQGASQIALLPKTGDGPWFGHPLVIVALLTLPGVGLVLLSQLFSFAMRTKSDNISGSK